MRYYDSNRKKIIIHALVPGKPFDAKAQNASNLIKIKIQKCQNGAIINGTPYTFRRRPIQTTTTSSEPVQTTPIYQRFSSIKDSFNTCVEEWEESITSNWTGCDNIFLSSNDLALVNKMLKEVREQIKIIEVKLNNASSIIK